MIGVSVSLWSLFVFFICIFQNHNDSFAIVGIQMYNL